MNPNQGPNSEIGLEWIDHNIVEGLRFLTKKDGNYFVGRTEFDSPEVDNEVLIDATKQYATIGSFVNVRVDYAEDFDLYGQIVK